jgi:hypothetical protein
MGGHQHEQPAAAAASKLFRVYFCDNGDSISKEKETRAAMKGGSFASPVVRLTAENVWNDNVVGKVGGGDHGPGT